MATSTAAGRGHRGPGPDTTSTKATGADRRHLRARAAKSDADIADAYKRGHADAKAGHPHGHSAPLEGYLDDYYDQGYQDGTAERRPTTPAGDTSSPADPEGAEGGRPAPAPAATPAPWFNPSVPKIEADEQGASFLLGLVAYALVLNYLSAGWPGVKAWMSAKFLNKPSTPTPGPGTAVLIPAANPGTGAPAPQSGTQVLA